MRGTRSGAGALLVLVVVLAWAMSAAGDQNESQERSLQQGHLTAGNSFTCALPFDGSVRCWGLDFFGQLGDGGAAASTQAPSTPVALGQSPRAITAGSEHTCALLADGSVRCWGLDANGQLGDGGAGTNTQAPSTPVALGQPARAITAGNQHTCALLADGSVRCWGADNRGQLGDGGVGTNTQAPSIPVALGQQAHAITAGVEHTCALLADGSVRCWGRDNEGQLGDGGAAGDTQAPSIPAALGQQARAITAGSYHTCALLADGSVRCWGLDNQGQLGHGAAVGDTQAPSVPVALGQQARAITGGDLHTCALLADGSVRCWGRDDEGELGDGGAGASTQEPSGPVALGQPARAVTSGTYHTCALLADGSVRCWGLDGTGQLGDGGASTNTQGPSTPVGGIVLAGSVGDLSLAAGASAADATVGDTLTVTLTAANAGPDATSPAIAAPLPAGLTLVSATPGQGSYSAATALWKAGPIAPGAAATLALTVRGSAAGDLAFVAEVVDSDAPDPDSTPANDGPGEDDRATTTIVMRPAPAGTSTDTGGGTNVSTAPVKVAADALTLAVGPRRDRTPPFRFAARGTLLVSSAALRDVCAGLVTITARAGTRKVLTQRAPLSLRRGLCRYRAPVVIRQRKRLGNARRLTFRAAFAGGDRVAAITSRPRYTRVR